MKAFYMILLLCCSSLAWAQNNTGKRAGTTTNGKSGTEVTTTDPATEDSAQTTTGTVEDKGSSSGSTEKVVATQTGKGDDGSGTGDGGSAGTGGTAQVGGFKWCTSKRKTGRKQYELLTPQGNVTAVVTDKKAAETVGALVTGYAAEVSNWTDYYAYGSAMPGRRSMPDQYRYGVDASEMDNEILGTGNMIHFKYRLYDARVARFISVDPIANQYPELTPYQFASLAPIEKREIEGLEGESIRGVAAVGLQVAWAKKKTVYTITGGAGVAMQLANNVGVEASAKGNFSFYKNGSAWKANMLYSLSGMAGMGDPRNMAGFATTGFVESGAFSFADFHPTIGTHAPILESRGNDFKGGGIELVDDFRRETPRSLSLIGRVGFGVSHNNQVDPNFPAGQVIDFTRRTNEFGANFALNFNQMEIVVEGTLLNSNTFFDGSGNAITGVNLTSVATVNNRLNAQVGVRIGLGYDNPFRGVSGSVTKNHPDRKYNYFAGFNIINDKENPDRKGGEVFTGGGVTSDPTVRDGGL